MAGKSKADRALAQRLAHENLERLAGGTVTLFLWPTKLSARDVPREETWDGWRTRPEYKQGGRVYCSPLCIMKSQGFGWYLTLPEIEERDGLIVTEYDVDDTMRVPKGTWPLSRYLVRKAYKADVLHFRCCHCKGPLRQALTPTKKRQKERLRKDRATARRKAKATPSPTRRGWLTVEQVLKADREAQAKRKDRADAQRKRRAKGRLTGPQRVAADRKRRLMEDKRKRDFKASDVGITQALNRKALRLGMKPVPREALWPDHWFDSTDG